MKEQKSVKFDVKLSFTDFKKINFEYMKSKLILGGISFLLIIILFNAYNMITKNETEMDSSVLFFPLAIIAGFTVFTFYYFMKLKKSFYSSEVLQETFHYSISDRKFEVQSKSHNSSLTLNKIDQVVSQKVSITIYTAEKHAYLIPKKYLSEDELKLLLKIFEENLESDRLVMR